MFECVIGSSTYGTIKKVYTGTVGCMTLFSFLMYMSVFTPGQNKCLTTDELIKMHASNPSSLLTSALIQ